MAQARGHVAAFVPEPGTPRAVSPFRASHVCSPLRLSSSFLLGQLCPPVSSHLRPPFSRGALPHLPAAVPRLGHTGSRPRAPPDGQLREGRVNAAGCFARTKSVRSTAPGVQWELSKPVRLRTPRPRPRPASPAVFSPIAAWLVPKEELVGGPAEARGALGPQGPAPCHTAVLFPRRPLDGNTCLSQRHSWAPLQVLHGDTDILFPVSGVGSYNPAGGCFWWAFLDRSFLLREPGLREPAGVGPPLPGGVGAGRRGPRQQGLWRQK